MIVATGPRAAAYHFLFSDGRPARIYRGRASIKLCVVPIRHPLPYVPGHVLNPERASPRRMNTRGLELAVTAK